MANSLKELGVTSGDRVATIAWNGYRHFELYYAISGGGAILHTINPRLSAEQMSFIINHAEDKVLIRLIRLRVSFMKAPRSYSWTLLSSKPFRPYCRSFLQ